MKLKNINKLIYLIKQFAFALVYAILVFVLSAIFIVVTISTHDNGTQSLEKITIIFGIFTLIFLLLSIKMKANRIAGLILVFFWLVISSFSFILISKIYANINTNQAKVPTFLANITIHPGISPSPTVTPIPIVYKQTNSSENTVNNTPWGVAKQIDQHTWTVKLGDDSTMATPQDIFTALNSYRQIHGVGVLSWDQNLASYAQSRTDYYASIKNTDEHAGLTALLNQPNGAGYRQLGYNHIGENSSIGYQLIGVHIIEWVYASDAEHNANQLDPSWTNVGIGVTGTGTDIIFAADHI